MGADYRLYQLVHNDWGRGYKIVRFVRINRHETKEKDPMYFVRESR